MTVRALYCCCRRSRYARTPALVTGAPHRASRSCSASCTYFSTQRLYHVMLTICATGIRVSELRFITAEALRAGRTEIRLKGKCRTVLLPQELAERLRRYARAQDIQEGPLFRTRTGRPLDRSNIWHEMKTLCREAGVMPEKVFPHNLRHLFAKCFYEQEKDLAHLADLLGHSSIETTRIYVAVSARAHEQILEKMRLIV